MTSENAKKIVDFLDFLNNWPSGHAFVFKVKDKEDFGSVVTIHCSKFAYQHQLNALMAVLDEMTGIMIIYRVNDEGKLAWRLW